MKTKGSNHRVDKTPSPLVTVIRSRTDPQAGGQEGPAADHVEHASDWVAVNTNPAADYHWHGEINSLVVASVTAVQETSTIPGLSPDSAVTTYNYSTSVKPLNTTSTTNITPGKTTENNTTTPTYNTVTTNDTTIAPTTSGDEIKTPTTMTTQAMATKPKTPSQSKSQKSQQARTLSQSVDFTSRPDDANIPFSTFDVDTAPHNGLQTFESTAKELQEPEAKPEVQEEQTAETDKSVDDPSETAALVPPPGSAEDKPKEEAVEQSPPPPVELSVEEKTDDEGVVSNKTSVESLKVTNENNSNSADFSQKKGLYLKFVIVIPCTN
ncbi:hypothetical protein F7725_005862 [Dissostichus mawsoni]|uniref:Uncharacterized protein n=1 Tax=Dissostichus mawsoni TaxID=36200 RepID=A0A7J5YVH9_DISMA|nr:hypothetical protein F7725_005862 [Dissostichus mawsoni]